MLMEGHHQLSHAVQPDPSIEPWEPCFPAPRAKDIIRHANEFDPIAYANATGEYKHDDGPRRSDRGYQPSVQALQNLADAPPSALLAIDANVSIYPIPDPGNEPTKALKPGSGTKPARAKWSTSGLATRMN